MRERLAERVREGDLVRRRLGQPAEEALVVVLARAEHDELHVAPREEAREDVEAEVEPLLPGQPRDDPDPRHARAVREPGAARELLRGELLAREVPCREVMGEVRVALGGPDVAVDAVEDPEEHVAAAAQERVHPHPLLRRGDLARVGRAHRGDRVRVEDPRQEEGEAPLVELLAVEHVARVLEPDVVEHVAAEERPLVADVVEREDGARPFEQPVPGEHRAQRHRDERALPVVDVRDVGREAELLRDA
ncbi:MAG: hypothetical protein R3B82_18405 [Sandaracinaceae bacterium]